MKTGKIFKGDKGIWVVFFLLSIISLVAVYSSIGLYAYASFANRTPTALFLRHALIVAVTYLLVIWLSHVNYRFFSRFAMLGYWATLVLLAVLLALNSGRWLNVPIIGSLQPSEIAKVVLVIFVARMLALKKDQVEELSTFIQLLIYIGLMVVLILPENLSMALLIFIVCYQMMLFGGVNRRYWWRVTMVMAVVGGIAVVLMLNKSDDGGGRVLERSETWSSRIDRWMHPQPDELSQENMAKMAIARGGVIGKGPGQTVHARLMTQAHNDFIYAIILEETGIVGGIAVFALYAIFYFRCIRLAWRCKGKFGALTVAGMGTMIYLQALINMCVAVGVLPVTGQTLPLISYGGTAYLFIGAGIGVIQSIAADVDAQDAAEGGVVPVSDSVEVKDDAEGEEDNDNVEQ